MAKKKGGVKGKSNVLDQALKAHATDSTEYGMDFIDLPPGINRGVAKLTEAKLGNYSSGKNKGGLFLHLAGSILEPRSVKHVPKLFNPDSGQVEAQPLEEVDVYGQFTRQTLPMCDFTKSNSEVIEADETVATALNELRKLGGEEVTETVDSEDSLREVLEAIKEQGIYFRFSTNASNPTAQYPEPRVWERWSGAKGLEDYEEEDGEDAGVEEAEDEEPEEAAEEQEEPEEVSEDADEQTWEEVGTLADEGDDGSIQYLTDAAAGQDPALDPNKYDTWLGLAQAIEAADEGGEEEPEEDAEEPAEEAEEAGEPEADDWAPEKKEVYDFRPPKAHKDVEVTVITVNNAKKTCTVTDLATKKTYKNQPWGRLA